MPSISSSSTVALVYCVIGKCSIIAMSYDASPYSLVLPREATIEYIPDLQDKIRTLIIHVYYIVLNDKQ